MVGSTSCHRAQHRHWEQVKPTYQRRPSPGRGGWMRCLYQRVAFTLSNIENSRRDVNGARALLAGPTWQDGHTVWLSSVCRGPCRRTATGWMNGPSAGLCRRQQHHVATWCGQTGGGPCACRGRFSLAVRPCFKGATKTRSHAAKAAPLPARKPATRFIQLPAHAQNGTGRDSVDEAAAGS